uniref:Uncharacterized protein n=1 Tax=Setaria viridis TaxID=4556 RepID=A0A4V6DB83_SETVI|nr:hypothetical protein SEVIR_2G182200v2 [Setaria viridis]TKW32656.1 hypothetical protein SEVIR_2G182200v2 [Setaria viridis]
MAEREGEGGATARQRLRARASEGGPERKLRRRRIRREWKRPRGRAAGLTAASAAIAQALRSGGGDGGRAGARARDGGGELREALDKHGAASQTPRRSHPPAVGVDRGILDALDTEAAKPAARLKLPLAEPAVRWFAWGSPRRFSLGPRGKAAVRHLTRALTSSCHCRRLLESARLFLPSRAYGAAAGAGRVLPNLPGLRERA